MDVSITDAPVDTIVDSPPDVPAICSDGGLGGIGVPAMTKATASCSYLTYTPDKAIDNDLNTAWSCGDNPAWIQLDFPAPTTFSGIRIMAEASPPEMQTFTITPSGSMTVLGTASRQVTNPKSILAAIPIAPGTYNGIRITVKPIQSWVQPWEISLLTQSCP